MSASKTSSRRLVGASTLGAGALLAAALLLIVNYFGWKYHDRLDATSSELYTLSEKSESVLANLDRDIEAVVFLSPNAVELYGPSMELLSLYEAASPRFSVRTVDPQKNPAEAQSLVDRYELMQLDLVVLDSGDDRRIVEASDLAEWDYSGVQMGQGPKLESFKGEQVFTSAILELAESTKPRVLITTGHGELALDDVSARGLKTAQEIMQRDNFEVEEWASLGASEVPPNTDLIVIAGPTAGFLEPEVTLLRDYLDGGGRLLALIDPILTETGGLGGTGLEELFGEFGVALGADLVVDPENPLPFYGAETIFANSFEPHPITRSLNEAQVPVIIPLARSVSAASDGGAFEVTELVRTSAGGWGETDLENLGAVELDENDLAGPVALGVAIARTGVEAAAEEESPVPDALALPDDAADDNSSATRMVVFGDSDFASNGHLTSVGNVELLTNALNWLVERENLLGIPPKSPEQAGLSLTRGQLRWLNWLILGILPALSVALGVAVYFRRRR